MDNLRPAGTQRAREGAEGEEGRISAGVNNCPGDILEANLSEEVSEGTLPQEAGGLGLSPTLVLSVPTPSHPRPEQPGLTNVTESQARGRQPGGEGLARVETPDLSLRACEPWLLRPPCPQRPYGTPGEQQSGAPTSVPIGANSSAFLWPSAHPEVARRPGLRSTRPPAPIRCAVSPRWRRRRNPLRSGCPHRPPVAAASPRSGAA